jgi:hypothetical protein
MRRLIFMLAAGLLAAGTVLTGGVASAGATAAHQVNCTNDPGFHFNVSKNGTNYFLGTPRTLVVGAAAFLKPTKNSTTTWTLCVLGGQTQINNGGLSLTSRSSGGQDVTLTAPGNGGNGFASQEWVYNFFTCQVNMTCVTFQNVKTTLFLRVRNSGPIMGQTVTTGLTPTDWIVSF